MNCHDKKNKYIFNFQESKLQNQESMVSIKFFEYSDSHQKYTGQNMYACTLLKVLNPRTVSKSRLYYR